MTFYRLYVPISEALKNDVVVAHGILVFVKFCNHLTSAIGLLHELSLIVKTYLGRYARILYRHSSRLYEYWLNIPESSNNEWRSFRVRIR